ncbi:hypothetical protein [Marmoricola sp. RAF53]|uniref:hypothetical protein n=1 Tax=Marmoricola sp. RAF53 TaxID=3233059 RepID=UPI003F9CC5DB
MRIGPVLGAGLLLLALAGCGDGSAAPDAAGTPASPSSTLTPEGDGELVPPGLTDDVPLPDLTATPKPPSAPKPADRVYGADVSWPQCPKGMGIPQKRSQGAPMPTAAAQFVIIGLTNGPSFVANPCIADQVGWARQRDLPVAAYAVVSYPDAATLARYGGTGPYDASTRLGALRNTGYQAALFNLSTLKAAGLPTPIVWVDVEPVTGFAWSSDTVANAAVVQGTAKAYADAGFRVGFYSTPNLWKRVVGDLRIGGPEWRAAGQTSQAEALRRCAGDWSFQGGPGVLGQWVEDGRDRDVACPGAVGDVRTWFGTF